MSLSIPNLHMGELAVVSCVISVFLVDLSTEGLALTVWPSPWRQFIFRDRCQSNSRFHLSFLHLFPFCISFLNGFHFAPQNAFLKVLWRWYNIIVLLLKQKVFFPAPPSYAIPAPFSGLFATKGPSLRVRWAQA